MTDLKISNRLCIFKKGNQKVAYNSVFGNFSVLDEMDELILESIKENKPLQPGPELNSRDLKNKLGRLMRNYFIVGNDFDEYSFIKDGLEKYKNDIKNGKRIRKLLFEVTENCNMKCKYCYVNHSRDLSGRNMSLSLAKKIVDNFLNIVESAKSQNLIHVRFFGGEPLLNFNLIKETVNYIDLRKSEDLSVKYYINTNGIYIDDEISEFLVANNFEVNISLDGPQEVNDRYRLLKSGNGTYEIIVRNIKLLLNKNIDPENLELYLTLHKYNIDYLEETVILCKELGIKKLEVEMLHAFEDKYNVDDNSKFEALVNVRKMAKKYNIQVNGKWLKLFNRLIKPSLNYCGRQAEQLAINASGEVYVCSGLNWKFGSIDDLQSILSNDEYLDIATRITGMLPSCNGCMIEGMCSGGCSGVSNALFKSGCSNEKNECNFRKRLISALIGFDDFDFAESESYQPTLHEYLKSYSDLFNTYNEDLTLYIDNLEAVSFEKSHK